MKNWQNLLVSGEETIKNVMSLFEKNGEQIAVVVKDNVLIGTVTDGDIRRGILKNIHTEDVVKKIMNPTPVTISNDISQTDIVVKFNALDIKYLPVVDNQRRVVDICSKSDLAEPFSKYNPIVIMAGGEGLRLRPFTENLPKPLVDINGTSILEKLLVNLINQGFQNFFLSINYLGEMIEGYFGDGKKWGINISYLKEDKKLGTAGSLKLLGNANDNILVLNGDLVTNVNFNRMLEYHASEEASVTIGIQKAVLRVPYGVVNYTGTFVSSLEEKPVLTYSINCGIYVISPQVVGLISENENIDMTCLISMLLEKQEKVVAFPIYEEWHDIGNVRDLERVRSSYNEA